MTSDPPQLFPGKQFISTVLAALETKSTMSGELARRYLQRAGMAGMIIGVLYAAHYAVVAAFDAVPAGDTTLHPLGRMVGAALFGWALVFIHYSKSELLTSNMMIVSIGAYYRRTSWFKAMRLLGLCYPGNFLGGLLVYIGLVKDDLMKSLIMIVAVFLFAFLGLEHSVANTVLFTVVGLQDGLDLGPASADVGIALAGNFLGGGVLIGFYCAYVNDDARYLPRAR